MAEYGSAFEEVATAIKSAFDAEFAAEGFTMVFDDLHEAMGRTRVDVAIAPLEDRVASNNNIVQETTVEVKFYDLWDERITPTTVVDPSKIAGYAERLRNALRNVRTVSTSQTWFFNIGRTTYPRDPTGNKTRFVMEITAYGNNAGLVETA